jgi:hypothetical protein
VFASTHDQKQPRVAAWWNGTVVVWREDTGTSNIRFAVLDKNDNLLVLRNVTNTSVRHHQPDIAVSGDMASMAWVDETLGPGTGEIYMATFNISGERIANNSRVSFDGVNVSQPAIAAGRDGNLTIAWVRNASLVQVKFYNSNLVNITGTLNASQNLSTYKGNPSIAITPNQTFVVWADDRHVANTSTLMMATFSSTTKASEGALISDSSRRFSPSIAIDSSQDKYIAYTRGVDTKADIAYLKFASSRATTSSRSTRPSSSTPLTGNSSSGRSAARRTTSVAST